MYLHKNHVNFDKTLTRIHQMHTQRGSSIGVVGTTRIQHLFDFLIRKTSEVLTSADHNYITYAEAIGRIDWRECFKADVRYWSRQVHIYTDINCLSWTRGCRSTDVE